MFKPVKLCASGKYLLKYLPPFNANPPPTINLPFKSRLPILARPTMGIAAVMEHSSLGMLLATWL